MILTSPSTLRAALLHGAALCLFFSCGPLALQAQTSPLDTAPGSDAAPFNNQAPSKSTSPATPAPTATLSVPVQPAASAPVQPVATPAPSTAPAAAVVPDVTNTPLVDPSLPSLVSDGDFSSATADPTWPDGWPRGKGISWETENGKHFLRLVTQEPGKMLMAYREVRIPDATKGIEIAIRYRTAGVRSGARPWFDTRAIFHFLDVNRKPVAPDPKAMIFSTKAATWTDAHVRAVVPAGAVTLQMMPALFMAASGTLDLAQVSVTALDPATVAQEQSAATDAAAKKAAALAAGAAKSDAKAAALLAATGSLVPNGNFETDSKGAGWPDGWGRGPSPGISWGVDNGKHFLRLVSQRPGQMLMLYQVTPIPLGTKGLEISFRYRTAGLKAGEQPWFDSRAILHFLDAGGKPLEHGPGAIVFSSKATDWTDAKLRVVVPEGAASLQMMPSLFQAAAGTLDLAEIKVAPISSGDATAMVAAAADQAKKEVEHAAILNQEMAGPAKSVELKVSGNKIVKPDGTQMWLQGVNVVNLSWSPTGENKIPWSIHVAINDWNANVIRLPVLDGLWFGRGRTPFKSNDQEAYRKIVDDAIQLAAAKGAYIVLDLHRFLTPDESCITFWKDAAARYKNNPAVLFDIFNEPHDTTWEVWRNGGPVEVKQKDKPSITVQGVGMQALVNAIRETGAKNIIMAGGLGYAYDLTGILKGFALEEKGGNGVMYATHFYNWHKGWAAHFLAVAEKYPILVGETGADARKMTFIPAADQEDGTTWTPDMLGLVQKYKLNWTAWSFHTSATPSLISDWNYTPTPACGVFVKDALHGKQFELTRMR